MSDNLFQRINDENAIQIVRQDEKDKPGYSWQWQNHEWQIRNGGVFESVKLTCRCYRESILVFCPNFEQ